MSSTIEITPNVQRLVEAISINQELKMDEMGMIMCTNCPRKYSNRGSQQVYILNNYELQLLISVALIRYNTCENAFLFLVSRTLYLRILLPSRISIRSVEFDSA